MLCRFLAGLQEACFSFSPRNAPRSDGPCHDGPKNASSSSSTMFLLEARAAAAQEDPTLDLPREPTEVFNGSRISSEDEYLVSLTKHDFRPCTVKLFP